jgi:hypothetical protein
MTLRAMEARSLLLVPCIKQEIRLSAGTAWPEGELDPVISGRTATSGEVIMK